MEFPVPFYMHYLMETCWAYYVSPARLEHNLTEGERVSIQDEIDRIFDDANNSTEFKERLEGLTLLDVIPDSIILNRRE